jgi:TolA-binding protein
MTLAQHLRVDPPTPEQELAAWHAVSDKLAGRQRRRAVIRTVMKGGAGLALAAGLFLVATQVFREPSAVTAGTVVGAEASPVLVSLSDGSKARVEPVSTILVRRDTPERLEVELTLGGATFEVVRRPQRRFAVVAGDIEVEVRGTEFTVHRRGQEHVEVSVLHGVVDVTQKSSGNLVARLTAGARWEGPIRASANLDAEPLQQAENEPAREPAAPTPEPTDRETMQAPAAEQPSPRPLARNAQSAEGAEVRGLFERASSARRSGDVAQAITLYGELVRRYPESEYSKLAALELGRLQLRAGHEPRAAAAALEQAIAKDPSSPLTPDALFHLLSAYEEAGDNVRCKATKARYLRQFPKGPHVSEVNKRCP